MLIYKQFKKLEDLEFTEKKIKKAAYQVGVLLFYSVWIG